MGLGSSKREGHFSTAHSAASAAQGVHPIALPKVCQLQQGTVIAIGGDEGHPKGQATARDPRGAGHGRLTQEIHKVGETAQFRVLTNGVQGHGFHARTRDHRGYHQGIQVLPNPLDFLPNFLHPVAGFERIHGRVLLSTLNHLPHHRIHLLGVQFHHGLNRGEALSHKGAVVEQGCRFKKEPHIHFHQLKAQCLGMLQTLGMALIKAQARITITGLGNANSHVPLGLRKPTHLCGIGLKKRLIPSAFHARHHARRIQRGQGKNRHHIQ